MSEEDASHINWTGFGVVITVLLAAGNLIYNYAGAETRGMQSQRDLFEIKTQITDLQKSLSPILVMQARLDADEKAIANIEHDLTEARDLARSARQDLDMLMRQQPSTRGGRP